MYPPFMLLLHKLGFHLPTDSGKAFVRIPAFWTAEILLNVAEKLGPVHQCEQHNARENDGRMNVECGTNTFCFLIAMLRFDLSELHDPLSVGLNLVQLKQNRNAKKTTYGMHRRHSMTR